MIPVSVALPAFGVALVGLPFALLSYWRARAIRGGAPGWFGFLVRARLLAMGVVLIQPCALAAMRPADPLRDAAGLTPALAWSLGVAIELLPAMATLCVVVVASQRLRRRLLGAESPAGGPGGAAGRMAIGFVSLLGLVAACAAFVAGYRRAGIAVALASYGIALWSRLRRMNVHGLTPEAVTTGPLRDRVVALAARARVRVEQVYVLPARRERVMNAFAVAGGRVLVTDTLLDQLSPREIDGVLAHELAHLRLGHPRWLVLAPAILLIAVATYAPPLGLFGFAWAALGVWALTLLLARRFEYSADARAAEWTQDPEALITALVKLAHANHLPLDWGRATSLALTHPSTSARARAFVRRGLLTPDHAERLLASPPEDAERWPHVVDSQPRIAGTSARVARVQSLAWTMVCACALAAALAFATARAVAPATPAPAAFALATLAALAASLLAFDGLATSGQRRWRDALASRLGPAAEGGEFVGVSPGGEPRLYEGLANWDVGFLRLDPDALRFEGDRARFSLARHRIVEVRAVSHGGSWLPAPRTLVGWRADDGTVRRFTIGSAGARWVHQVPGENARRIASLERWCQQPGPVGVTPIETGEPPVPERISGVPLRAGPSVHGLIALAVRVGLASLAAALVANLPLAPGRGFGAPEVFGASLAAVLLLRLPAFVRTKRPGREARTALDRAA